MRRSWMRLATRLAGPSWPASVVARWRWVNWHRGYR